MICISVQCHGGIEFIPWLASCLRHAKIRLLFSYDGSRENADALAAALADRGIEASVIHSIPVAWGGRSVVESMLNAMTHAFSTWSDVSTVMFASGSCFPLMPAHDIVSFLSHKAESGHTSFVNDFIPNVDRQLLAAVDAPTGDYVEAQWMKGKGARILYDISLKPMFADMANSPLKRPGLRYFLYMQEIYGKRALYLRPLTRMERLDRNAAMAGLPIRCGRQWIVLSRRIGEWILERRNEIGLRSHLLDSFIPDEAYFQTLISRMPGALSKDVEKVNYRLAAGKPLTVNDANFEQVLAESWGKLLMGRKIEHGKAARMRERLSQLCGA